MSSQRDRTIAIAERLFGQLPSAAKFVAIAVALAIGLVAFVAFKGQKTAPPATTEPTRVVFMFWNVENLFDDRDDKRNSIDDPYDNWFAQDAGARKLKYDHLAEIILRSTMERDRTCSPGSKWRACVRRNCSAMR